MRGLVHQVGLNTSDATATAGDLLSGKTAYVDGNKVTGTILSKAAATITPAATEQVIAAGQFLSGAQTISGDADLVSTNIKAGTNIFGVNGNSNVVDTADGSVDATWIVNGGVAYSKGSRFVGTIPRKVAQTYTPGTTNQTIPAGQYTDGVQTIVGDADLVSANIKAGANIFGVAGNANVVDTSAGTAAAGHILSGYKAYVDGALLTGTIPSQGAQTITPGTANKTIASGMYLSGTQTIAGDADLIAANIISGKNIFGVDGSALPYRAITGSVSSTKGVTHTIQTGINIRHVLVSYSSYWFIFGSYRSDGTWLSERYYSGDGTTIITLPTATSFSFSQQWVNATLYYIALGY